MDKHKEGSQTSDGLSAREIDEREALLISNRIGEKFGISENDAAGWRRVVEQLMVVREVRSIADVGFLGGWEPKSLEPIEKFIPPKQMRASLEAQAQLFDVMECEGRPERFERALTFLLAMSEIRDRIKLGQPDSEDDDLGWIAEQLLMFQHHFEVFAEGRKRAWKQSATKLTKTRIIKDYVAWKGEDAKKPKAKRDDPFPKAATVSYVFRRLQEAEKVKIIQVDGIYVCMTPEDCFVERLTMMEAEIEKIERRYRISLIPYEVVQKHKARRNRIEDRPAAKLNPAREKDRRELKRRHALLVAGRPPVDWGASLKQLEEVIAVYDRIFPEMRDRWIRPGDKRWGKNFSPAEAHKPSPAYPYLTDEDARFIEARRSQDELIYRMFAKTAHKT